MSAKWIGLGSVVVLAGAVIGACGGDDDDGSGLDPDADGGLADGAQPPQRAEFGLDTRAANKTCKAPARPPSTAPIKLEEVYGPLDLGTPMAAAQRPGDPSRWYVARRDGTIIRFQTQNPTATVAVRLSGGGAVAGSPGLTEAGEGGLLNFVFHPKFATNGKAYVSFTAPPNAANSSMRSVIGELTSSNGGDTFTAYKTILVFNQPQANNHKGGGLAFGKDGFLYASFGDGGGGGDTYVAGQKTTGFLSKVLRIDVDNPSGDLAYGIPDGNPFKASGGEPATFAWGFRNPFRLSVDRETGEVWVGEVGQDKWEEIDKVELGGNYGWSCMEATHDYAPTNAEKCPNGTAGLKLPLVEHEHVPANSRSITGGVVYRGTAIPNFAGTYVYGDYKQNELWTLTFDLDSGEPKSTRVEGAPTEPWVAFAEDANGELYGLTFGGKMYAFRAADSGGAASTFPARLSETGCVDRADPTRPAEGLIPFGVNAELWSDGAEKERFVALPDGETITVRADGDFDLPVGSVVMKSFILGGKRIETRLLVRHDDGGWAGYTYEWLDDGSDAVLLAGAKTKQVGAQSWYYPSRSDCARCHTDAAGRTLGLELGQLNGDLVYTSTNRISNQLRTLEHIGVFSAPLGKPPAELVAYPTPSGSGPAEGRARAYLHANCANCHRPNGPGRGGWDIRFGTTLAATNACDREPEAGDLGVAGAKLIAPGAPQKSLVSLRPHALGANRMPPLASGVVDEAGLTVVDAWIRELGACP